MVGGVGVKAELRRGGWGGGRELALLREFGVGPRNHHGVAPRRYRVSGEMSISSVQATVPRTTCALLEALSRDPLGELRALGTNRPRVGLRLDEDSLALLPVGRHALGGDPELGGTARDGGDEITPGLGGLGLELAGVHVACFGK